MKPEQLNIITEWLEKNGNKEIEKEVLEEVIDREIQRAIEIELKRDEFAVKFAEWCIAKAMRVDKFKLKKKEIQIYKETLNK